VAQLEAIVGSEKRLKLVRRTSFRTTSSGSKHGRKAMIVCMSRRICVDLYREIAKLRPDWHHEDDESGLLKIVMTGSATDPLDCSSTSATSHAVRHSQPFPRSEGPV